MNPYASAASMMQVVTSIEVTEAQLQLFSAAVVSSVACGRQLDESTLDRCAKNAGMKPLTGGEAQLLWGLLAYFSEARE